MLSTDQEPKVYRRVIYDFDQESIALSAIKSPIAGENGFSLSLRLRDYCSLVHAYFVNLRPAIGRVPFEERIVH